MTFTMTLFLDQILELLALTFSYKVTTRGSKPRGAADSRHVHIHRDDFVHTLKDGIVIEDAAARSAVTMR